MKRLLILLSLVLLASGCSWANHMIDRQASGKSSTSIAIDGQAQGPAVARYAKKYVEMLDGSIASVADDNRIVFEFPFMAEDGATFVVSCPDTSIEFCSKIEGGEWLKVGGFRDRPTTDGIITATYVRRK